MIKIIPYEKLGHRNYGWLDAHYHFSFGEYHDPARMGFGPLRVVNDDIVRAGAGFPMHPHRDMEIITYVRSGAITHEDSLGNKGRTAAGDVQVMSAGSGIVHAEYNSEKTDATLYQIWIQPRARSIAPRWDAAQFPKAPVNDSLKLLVSGRAEDEDKGALSIHADAALYGGRLEKNRTVAQNLRGNGYLLVSEGSVMLDGHHLKKGDGAAITGQETVSVTAQEQAEIILIDLA